MKKISIGITMIIIFMFCLFIEQNYTREVTVIDVNKGIVYVDDGNHTWSYYGDNVEIGQKITVLMHTNNTDNIVTDDTIIRVIK